MDLVKIILITLLVIFSVEAKMLDRWEIADRQTIRLAPSEFSQLPKEVIKDLEKRKCTIPQSFGISEIHNVIQGEFKRKGQKDWAILCSQKRISSILIYWDGSIKNISKIAAADDKGFLQTIGKEKIGFSRIIDAVDERYIYEHYKAYGGPKPPKITHDGINDAFAEKASMLLYLHRGKWLELRGAD